MGPEEGRIFQLGHGEKVADLMSEWTRCPIGNGTCQDMVEVHMYAINPDLGGCATTVALCPLGVAGAGEKCPLNK